MGLAVALVCAMTPARTYAQEKQKKVKDQGEYDLFNAYSKETDPAKKLQYLNQWVEKYPESDYQDEQLRFYSDLNQPAKVMELGAKILAKDPKDFAALSLITANIRNLPNPTPDQLELGQKAAQTLLDNLDSLKPANVKDDAWQQAKPGVQQLAKGTLLWIAMTPSRRRITRRPSRPTPRLCSSIRTARTSRTGLAPCSFPSAIRTNSRRPFTKSPGPWRWIRLKAGSLPRRAPRWTPT